MVAIKLEGIGSVFAVFNRLAEDIGDKKATSKILVPAVREAMKPVLAAAKRNAPDDTGALMRSLQIEARRPTRRDRRSKYITQTDTVIATVTTAPGKKLAKMGIKSDGRAIAMEFGTRSISAHPYLRPALEANAQGTVARLGEILARRLNEYRKIQ